MLGSQIRSYCYCLDSASAILKTLVKGEPVRAYNISNPESIISIREMAELLAKSAGVELKMEIPTDLIPKCPDDGSEMTVSLRCDDTFVQDAGWYAAQKRYHDFLRLHENQQVLYLELGVGMNTPVIIKYPFWQYTQENPKAFYACVNKGEAYCPREIARRSVCINEDIGEVLQKLF